MSVTYVSGATSSGLVIDHGSLLQVQAGGTIVNTTFNGGTGFLEVSAAAISTVVNASGFFGVQNGSVASSVMVNNGGKAGPDFGGSMDNVVVNSGGTLSVDTTGDVSGVVVNPGGVFDVLAGGTATGVVLNGGTLDVAVGGTVTGAIGFAPGTGGTVVVSSPASAGNDIPLLTYSGFGPHDTIDLMGATYTSATSFVTAGDTLSLVVSMPFLQPIQFPMIMEAPQPGIAFVTAVNRANLSTEIVACFAAGTRIATADGETPVERLRVGDRVRTAGGAFAPVRWLGHRTVEPARHRPAVDLRPVRIRRHAFGSGQPHRDLLLSPDHAVFVEGVLIPVRYLVNGATIVREHRARITYWHVELAAHDLLLAEGLACESYLDTGNRAAFANGEASVMLHPDFARRVWQAQGCAPLLLDGPVLAAARAGLLAQAERLGWTRTGDPDLHLRIDGVRHDAVSEGRLHRFRLPAAARSLHLVSRAGVPAETRPDGTDHRRLGVAVGTLLVNGRALPLGDPRLGAGWHGAEDGWRWTDGHAALALAGAAELAVVVAMSECYWMAPDDAERARKSIAQQ